MLSEQIRQFRKEKGLSQEELADSLHVVRQTVSKWERGLSVPDADCLLRLAEVLDVPVSRLLEPSESCATAESLSAELADVQTKLAKCLQQERRMRLAGQKRGWILFFSFLAVLSAQITNHEMAALLLIGACTLAAITVLYRNLALLTSVTTEDAHIGALRAATVFNIGVLVIAIVYAGLTAANVLSVSQTGEQGFAMALVICVMLVAGLLSPRLPFNRHTGLRLPWTVQDAQTWNLAHRILGVLSLPTALFYAACARTIPDFEAVTLCAMLLWIGIPGGISYWFFRRKMRGEIHRRDT